MKGGRQQWAWEGRARVLVSEGIYPGPSRLILGDEEKRKEDGAHITTFTKDRSTEGEGVAFSKGRGGQQDIEWTIFGTIWLLRRKKQIADVTARSFV